MPSLERPGGVELHWEERGEGPLVALAPYWSGHPGAYQGLLDELARDHRVRVWDARGTGRSTRQGPFDMKTDCADLVAMLEAAGGDATVLCVADGANRAVRVAADRPDLGARVVAMGAAPMSRRTFENTDAMVGSPTVVEAFLQMLEKDYRGALRTLLASTNEQMTEAELRHRVEIQVSYCPQETAIDRVRAWAEDEPVESAQRVGDRLWILAAPDVAGPWLPPYGRLRRILAELMPDANVIEGQRGEGPVSRPDVVAGLIREITGVRA